LIQTHFGTKNLIVENLNYFFHLCLFKNTFLKKISFLLQGPGWDYETELPEWARVDWKENE
jgi:hypothetical protein